MLKRTVSLIALTALLIGCSAAAASIDASPQASLAPVAMVEPAPIEATFTPASYDEAPLTCEVRSRRTANGVLLQARAFADRDIDAYYDLRIVKSGGGNSSITIYGPDNVEVRGGVISFTFRDLHPHDVSQVLDQRNVCVRAGHHCAKPLMQTLGVNATTRASLYLYNDERDVDALVEALDGASDIFGF
jgi:hypothetical protein